MDAKPGTTRAPGLTRLELKAKTAWIRDCLEPYIAQNGPEPLSPDTVLELAAFFSHLLSQTTSSVSAQQMFPGLGLQYKPGSSITLEDIKASRIHRALLVITGRGTRWPGKLIELCDVLVSTWNERFGDLNMIRPLLYEKGGRLHEVRAEKEMSRHALLLKWLSDRSSLVSPLRALEAGHLEFKPGQWWIHPIFAFHDGVVDSPDPHGGITADADGAYAITLTGYDEVDSPSPEIFTYRVRKDDKGQHRLLQGFLPQKQPIRVLRSHTLHSMWSPVAGLRYDGLYKISSYSVAANKDKTMRFEVRMKREADQAPMRDVHKHPTAEEVDDYIEYKRLRYLRLDKLRGSIKLPKVEQVLGVIPTLQDPSAEFEQELDEAMQMHRRGAVNPWGQRDAITELTAHRRDQDDSPRSVHEHEEAMLSTLDGAPLLPTCSNPSAHSAAPGQRNIGLAPLREKWRAPKPMGPLRKCCDDDIDKGDTRSQECRTEKRQDSGFDFAQEYKNTLLYFEGIQGKDPKLSLDHAMLQTLESNINVLVEVTRSRGGMSSAFLEDLKGMSSIVNQWEKESVSTDGYVDRCLWDVTEAIDKLRHGQEIVWEMPEDERGGELKRLSEYQGTWRRCSSNGWKDVKPIHVGDIQHIPLGDDEVCSAGCVEISA